MKFFRTYLKICGFNLLLNKNYFRRRSVWKCLLVGISIVFLNIDIAEASVTKVN